MIARLAELSTTAKPTHFHRLLRSLDDSGKLLRVYTQNIDALEVKSGLSFGVPEYDMRRKARSKPVASSSSSSTMQQDISDREDSIRLPTPPSDTPRCIPLHGTLQLLHCQICTHSFPLDHHLTSLTSGILPPCPECTSMERTRQLIGKRPRGVGKLRPSVVLYNEAHKDGEGVGEAARRDLVGSKGKSGADLLLVVGTSLRVPGTKRMVREFAKAVHSRSTPKENTPGPSTPPSPKPPVEDDFQSKAIYLNLDFPVPTREWEGVFDVWLQGDAQQFAEVLRTELDKATRAKELAEERRRKREEEAENLDLPGEETPIKKRKTTSEPSTPTKRKKAAPFVAPPSPESPIRGTSLKPPAYLIPEVVITTRTSACSTPIKNSPFARGSSPPTPGKSPPRAAKEEARGTSSWVSQLNRLTGYRGYRPAPYIFDMFYSVEEERNTSSMNVSYVRTQT